LRGPQESSKSQTEARMSAAALRESAASLGQPSLASAQRKFYFSTPV
jgi:hypothetical protein